MKMNVGKADSVARLILAAVIFGAGYYYQSWWGLVGFVPVATGLTRRCPVYMPFGFSTCAKNEKA
jgi:hypothetical protein